MMTKNSIRNKSVNKLVVRNYDSSLGYYTPRETLILSCALLQSCTLVHPILILRNIYRSAISNCASYLNRSFKFRQRYPCTEAIYNRHHPKKAAQ
jgi:hypothetical protein